MTERLYYPDSYCTSFDAHVIECLKFNGSPAVVLDRTAFYPTGGGQPHDTGTLNGIPVVDVVEREEDQAPVHVISPAKPEDGLQPGDQVQGVFDWPRRFDHMQQHTGQHLLSQAFVQIAEADTVGFHLSEDYSTIDLDRAMLSDVYIARVEALANQVIFEDRPVAAFFLDPDKAADLPLRKSPPAKDSLRVVQVEGFDWSACGGTHVARTGEIGLVKIVREERRGPELRVTFLCGHRALAHYHMLNTLTRELAISLSVGVEELPQTLERLQTEARAARKERDRLRQLLLDHEAVALIASSQVIGPISLVCKVFERREVEEVRQLATRIAGQPGHLALLGVRADKAQLVFARSSDLSYDMRPLLQTACRLVGGGGGGGPDLAQGGGPHPAHIDEAMGQVTDLLRQQIEHSGKPELSEFDNFVPFYDLLYGAQEDDVQMYCDFALAANGPILELGCGTGRVLIPLALKGHHVTGLELSAAMLAETQAKVDAARVADRVSLIQGDMRDFELQSRFALAIISINTFMHCYGIDQQLACLRSVHRHLQPGGCLVVDVFHPDPQVLMESDGRLISEGTRVNPKTGDTIHHLYTRRLDLSTQIQHVTFILDEIDAKGIVRRTLFPFRMRFVYRYEMELLMRAVGFSLEAVYGSYDLEPFDSGSERMVFVARVD